MNERYSSNILIKIQSINYNGHDQFLWVFQLYSWSIISKKCCDLQPLIIYILMLMLRFFANIYPWKRSWLFVWTNFNPFTQGYFMPSLVEIGPVVLENILNTSMCRYFFIIYPLEKPRSFIGRNLNLLYPRIQCAKFDWNWSCDSWGEVANVKCLQTDEQRIKAHFNFQLTQTNNVWDGANCD